MQDVRIKMYTTAACASCQMVKKWLGSKNLEWDEIRVDENPEAQKEAIELSSQITVPVTVIEKSNGERSVVVGFKPSILAEGLR
jgi:glutaredoxin